MLHEYCTSWWLVGMAELAACLCFHPQLISISGIILSPLFGSLVSGTCFHPPQTSKDWNNYAAVFLRQDYK